MSAIPTRRTTRTTRSAKEAENAISRPTTRTNATRVKAGLSSTTTRTVNGATTLTHTRATSSTAASKAKAIGTTNTAPTDDGKDGNVAIKRKREVLVEVTGHVTNNKASAPVGAKREEKDATAAVIKPKGLVKVAKASTRIAGVSGLKKATFRAPSESTTISRTDTEPSSKPSEVDNHHGDKMDIDELQPSKRSLADEEESARVFKKRHTDSKPLPKVETHDQSQEDADRVAAELQKDEPSPIVEVWDDLDADDWDDPVMVSEYVADVCIYLKEAELSTMPDPDYMRIQTEVTWEHRGILLDWLLQVHARFNLLAESFFLTVNILDRFLSVKPVSLAKLQLVGLAAFFIATKYEETYAPSVRQIAFLADDQYTAEEVLKAEKYILKTIEYDLKAPGPMGWLRRGSKADDCEVRARTVSKYLLEIGCLERRLIKYVPSQVAAASLWLARLALGREEWTPNLEHYTTYAEKELIPIADIMLEYIITEPAPHESLYKKYAHKKYFKCSAYMRQWGLDRWEENSDIKLSRDLSLIKEDIRSHREALLAQGGYEEEAAEGEA